MPELCVDTRRVGGAFAVEENARRIMHYRFAENVCMTTEGAWAPTSPAIKVKFALGEHCYQDSIHSFWLGQRLPELREMEGADLATPPTLRGSVRAEPPNEAFLRFCEEVQLQTDQLLRIVGLYRLTFRDAEIILDKAKGEPIFLILAMTPDRKLRMKPQNLVVGLPLAHLEAVS